MNPEEININQKNIDDEIIDKLIKTAKKAESKTWFLQVWWQSLEREETIEHAIDTTIRTIEKYPSPPDKNNSGS